MRFRNTIFILAFFIVVPLASAQPEVPRVHDPRLVVELFAQAPDIVHPISLDFDEKGRLLVIESHTHFAPQGYKGPKFDRIRMMEDTQGTGKADRFTTFFEGTRHTMDLAVHPDGSVYVATRNEILRLRDTTGAGKADETTRIVFLDTKGDYPHNGLSGLCFDSQGNLIFGMGENLGAAYKLVGADGATIAGEGDGGHIFWCTADGKKLRRIATGYWNPFGSCRDIFGRIFTVDNDPDQAPPCRMVHTVEGGDYGFQFRYGRSGKHPFQSWHGQLMGTLPMMTGVGEAPCEVLSYESDGLPKEYRGQLLVTSWADHRVERYSVKPNGASFKAERLPFVQGGNDFRPTGLGTAPDGSIYFSDWVKRDYSLHNHGAIWRLRWKDAKKMPRPQEPHEGLFSGHRPLREAAAKKLAVSQRGFLRKHLTHEDVGIRAAALTALLDVDDRVVNLRAIAEKDAVVGMREMALRGMVRRRENVASFLDAKQPGSLRALAIESLVDFNDDARLLEFLSDADPFLRNAAIQQLARNPLLLLGIDVSTLRDPRQRMGVLLAERITPRRSTPPPLKTFLDDPDEDVRFLAAKWIADEQLADYRPAVVAALDNASLNVRLYMGYATALARLDRQEVSDAKLADYFVKRLGDDKTPPALRIQLLPQIPASHAKLTVDLLGKLISQEDRALKYETVRALAEHPSPKRSPFLLEVFRNPKLDTSMRAYALLGLADRAQDLADELAEIANKKDSPLKDDAERILLGVRVKGMVMARKPITDRPPANDLDAWMKRLDGPANPSVGERVFFHPKLGGCFRCHKIDGRGKDVGPDLSSIGRTDRRHILESILQPSNTVAPNYQVWQLEMNNGKTSTGMLLHTQLDEYTYLDSKGDKFKVTTRDVLETRALPISIMPDGLADLMADQEIRDLLAYLESRK